MLKFIPAHSPGTFEGYNINEKPIAWWTKDNPFFKYPYLFRNFSWHIPIIRQNNNQIGYYSQ